MAKIIVLGAMKLSLIHIQMCIRDSTGTQTIKGDANLIEANIKKDVTIFGKTGTWEGYVKNDTTFIYNGGTNYDGFSIPSENIRDGYLQMCIRDRR